MPNHLVGRSKIHKLAPHVRNVAWMDTKLIAAKARNTVSQLLASC